MRKVTLSEREGLPFGIKHDGDVVKSVIWSPLPNAGITLEDMRYAKSIDDTIKAARAAGRGEVLLDEPEFGYLANKLGKMQFAEGTPALFEVVQGIVSAKKLTAEEVAQLRAA